MSASIEARPGRTCPIGYGYSPDEFARAPALHVETLYVVGGLYGNRYALDAVEALALRERTPARLVFNGDFHWFDVQPQIFGDIHARVLEHIALRGNVETELAGDDAAAGCGCAYPDDTSDDQVAWSNQIMVRLHATAQQALAAARPSLIDLPMYLLAQVGAARIGIVHGDATSLAGWNFSRDQLDNPSRRAINEQIFRQSEVTLFASSHTCLPALRRFKVNGKECGVINNGAAGMPNFSRTRHGVISRIAMTPAPSFLPVLTERIFKVDGDNLYVAAVALCYDDAAWQQQFCTDWPADSPASLSYLQRMKNGPAYRIDQAYPPGFK